MDWNWLRTQEPKGPLEFQSFGEVFWLSDPESICLWSRRGADSVMGASVGPSVKGWARVKLKSDSNSDVDKGGSSLFTQILWPLAWFQRLELWETSSSGVVISPVACIPSRSKGARQFGPRNLENSSRFSF